MDNIYSNIYTMTKSLPKIVRRTSLILQSDAMSSRYQQRRKINQTTRRHILKDGAIHRQPQISQMNAVFPYLMIQYITTSVEKYFTYFIGELWWSQANECSSCVDRSLQRWLKWRGNTIRGLLGDNTNVVRVSSSLLYGSIISLLWRTSGSEHTVAEFMSLYLILFVILKSTTTDLFFLYFPSLNFV